MKLEAKKLLFDLIAACSDVAQFTGKCGKLARRARWSRCNEMIKRSLRFDMRERGQLLEASTGTGQFPEVNA